MGSMFALEAIFITSQGTGGTCPVNARIPSRDVRVTMTFSRRLILAILP